MDKGLQKHFINTVANSADRELDGDATYDCVFCYRKGLKAEMISHLSHGEAYCKVCTKGKV